MGTRFDEADRAVAEVIRKRALARSETVKAMAPRLRARAVAAAGVEDAKVLGAVREACAKVPEGKDWREARKEVAEAIGDKSAARRRAELVLRTQCETARAQARWAEMRRQADTMPYLMYDTMRDENVRPSHKALDGKIFRIDDPFWKTHYPPWDWGCRCTVIQMDAEQAREMCEDGVGQMASDEFKRDFQAMYGNEKHTFEFDREGGADFTEMGLDEEERRTMHDVLSSPAHEVVNERGERENAWEWLWRTGPQAKDEAELREAAADGAEHVVVRDAETGDVLERATGTVTSVGTEEDWYRKGLPGKVRATHVHPGARVATPSPLDVVTALEPRSEAETVVAQLGGSMTLRPRPAEKLRRNQWAEALMEMQRALDAGEMEEAEWRSWLFDRRDIFGTGGAE